MRSLGVFSRRPLDSAPPRLCGVTVMHVIGVLVVYLGIEISAMMVAMHAFAAPASTLPAATAPEWAATSAASQAVSAATAAATQAVSAATAAATQPAASQAFDPATFAMRLRQYSAVAFSRVALIAILLLLARTLTQPKYDNGGSFLGLGKRQLLKAFLPTVVAAFLLVAPITLVNLGTVVVMNLLHKVPEKHQILSELQGNPPLLLTSLLVLTAAILAPLSEELFFRGFLQTALLQKSPLGTFGNPPLDSALTPPTAARRWFAIVVTSALFTVIHMKPEFFPTLFVLSLGLGYLYERTGSLWGPILLHALFNSTSLAATLYGN